MFVSLHYVFAFKANFCEVYIPVLFLFSYRNMVILICIVFLIPYWIPNLLPVLCYFSYPKQAYIEDCNNLALMPTFLDITGLEDEESEINKEMLRILFNGKLKEREDLNSVRQYYFNNGQNIQKLRRLYNMRSENARVDRIIVVCTANRAPHLYQIVYWEPSEIQQR